MPCYRCGARQVDPVRGASPWKQAVRDDALVLVCPECQDNRDWTADLDRCPRCASTWLTCRLGDVECRSCGWLRPAGHRPTPSAETEVPGLSEEVEAALDRVLGPSRTPVSH